MIPRSSIYAPSLFDQTDPLSGGRFGALPFGSTGQTIQDSHQGHILHSAGQRSAMEGRQLLAVRQHQGMIQQEIRRQEQARRMTFNAQMLNVNAQMLKKDSINKKQIAGVKATPVFYVKKKWNHVNHDYRIWRDGKIHKRPNGLKFDRFGVESAQWRKGNMIYRSYRTVAILTVNEYGLVNFPANNESLNVTRYGGVQKSQVLKDKDRKGNRFEEHVGEGDHYLFPETAAALFGLLNSLNEQGIHVALGDMSTHNGSDPGTPRSSTGEYGHHAGHGHMGKRSGLDIDFRYIGKDGNSYRGKMSDKAFNVAYNQKFYDTAFLFGFDRDNTYQGNSKLLKRVTTAGGHENHGHLGFGITPSNVITDIPDDYVPNHK